MPLDVTETKLWMHELIHQVKLETGQLQNSETITLHRKHGTWKTETLRTGCALCPASLSERPWLITWSITVPRVSSETFQLHLYPTQTPLPLRTPPSMLMRNSTDVAPLTACRLSANWRCQRGALVISYGSRWFLIFRSCLVLKQWGLGCLNDSCVKKGLTHLEEASPALLRDDGNWGDPSFFRQSRKTVITFCVAFCSQWWCQRTKLTGGRRTRSPLRSTRRPAAASGPGWPSPRHKGSATRLHPFFIYNEKRLDLWTNHSNIDCETNTWV